MQKQAYCTMEDAQVTMDVYKKLAESPPGLIYPGKYIVHDIVQAHISNIVVESLALYTL